jgi:hypothetical protein
MKLGLMNFITFIISIAVLMIFKLEMWAFLLIFVPLYLIVSTYFTAWYNMNGKIQPKSIPSSGYESRIQTINSIAPEIERLGFREIDRFYLGIIPDTIIIAYKHTYEPVYFCFYHLGTKISCDYVTKYGYEMTLTTNNLAEGGTLPRPIEAMLQIFPKTSYEQLFHKHLIGHRFILSKGITLHDFQAGEFRDVFMRSFKTQWSYLKKHPLWPLPTIFRTVTRLGIKSLAPIEKQWKWIEPRLKKMSDYGALR